MSTADLASPTERYARLPLDLIVPSTAKVEVDFLKVTGGSQGTGFMPDDLDAKRPAPRPAPPLTSQARAGAVDAHDVARTLGVSTEAARAIVADLPASSAPSGPSPVPASLAAPASLARDRELAQVLHRLFLSGASYSAREIVRNVRGQIPNTDPADLDHLLTRLVAASCLEVIKGGRWRRTSEWSAGQAMKLFAPAREIA